MAEVELRRLDVEQGTTLGGVRDWLLQRRDALLRNRAFHDLVFRVPGLRSIGRRRAQELFDICAGFVYSQALLAAVQLNVLEEVGQVPRSAAELAVRVDLDEEQSERLLRALASLRLVQRRSDGRYGLGELGAAFLANAGLREMVLHHADLYKDLSDPVGLLRSHARASALSDYWGYGVDAAPEGIEAERTEGFSRLMSQTLPDLAREVLDAYPVRRHRRLLDVGGGNGAFLRIAAQRSAELDLWMFDLPSVAGQANREMRNAGLADRSQIFAGNFKTDPLPEGADLITFVRILLDHDDETVAKLLERAAKAVAPGGRVLIAEPMSYPQDGSCVADAYFGFYLLAMGHGRARRPKEIVALADAAGLRNCRLIQTRRPILVQLIVADSPQ